MSFGQKPAAWARTPDAQSQQQINQSILGQLAGQSFAGIPNINALVNQAAFSNMNTVLAQAAQQQQTQRLLSQALPAVTQPTRAAAASAQSPPTSRNQRTFIGTVTKLMETYGFVDEDVFFQTNVIRGAMPRVGDRVMVEASFNPNMPFKWNAYRIQLPQGQQQQHEVLPAPIQPPQHVRPTLQPTPQHHPQQSQHTFASNNNSQSRWGQANDRREEMPPQRHQPQHDNRPHVQHQQQHPPHRQRNDIRRSPPRRSPAHVKPPPPVNLKREREKSPIHRVSREQARSRSPAVSVTASSKRDADSPPRRRQRIVPRYRCYKPKALPSSGDVVYQELYKRYSNLYIPSDFIKCQFSWLNSIQLDAPIKFSPQNLSFTIMHKDVDNLVVGAADGYDGAEQPPDADNRYVVKVMLLSHPGLIALRQKMHGLLADGSIDETADLQSLVKNLQVLVGVKNKNENMCIGGPWSPSLDGECPLDPQTLINTAIRTTRNLVGIDLSACPKWYKMVHLHYYRAERNRVDSVVLMLPDISSTAFLMPNEEELKELENQLKSQLAAKLAAIDSEQFISPNDEKVDGGRNSSASGGNAPATDGSGGEKTDPSVGAESSDQVNGGRVESTAHEEAAASAPSDPAATPSEVQADGDGSMTSNLKNMKVIELREELEKRGLDSKGVKNVLLKRLQDAIEKEGSTADGSDSTSQTIAVGDAMVNVKKEIVEPMETDKAAAEAAKAAAEKAEAERLTKERKALEKAKEKFEKDKKDRKAALQRHFVPPKTASVFVYPSKIARGGKFDCKVVSLESLLEYSVEDNKESTFEVAIFAETIRESLDRANAFVVYYALESAEERTVERERRDKALSEALNEGCDDVVILEENGNEKKSKKDDKKDPCRSFKALVYNADVFSAFAYFDENGSTYIEDRDMEDIIFSVGLDLSRGEVHRLIKKLSNRDRCNYRNLTDKWVDADGNAKYFSTPAENSKTMEQLVSGHEMESKKDESGKVSLGTTPDITDTGVVFYKGSVLNIAKTLEQHQAIEKERNDTAVKNDELDMQLKSVKKQRDQFEKSKKRLETDVSHYKKKLYEAEKCLKAAQEGSALYKIALNDCKKYAARVQTVVDKAIPHPRKDKKSEERDQDAKNALENGDVEIVLTEEVRNDDSEQLKLIDATSEENVGKSTVDGDTDTAANGAIPTVDANAEPTADANAETKTVAPAAETTNATTEVETCDGNAETTAGGDAMADLSATTDAMETN